jgi:glutathione S-transferase
VTDELVFYTHPMSRGRIVRWMLEEIGRPYRTEMLDYGTTMKAPSYLSINPMGKVPAIRHGEMGFVVPDEREKMMGYGRFGNVMNTLDGLFSRAEYLVGDSFTAADVYVGSHIGFGMQFGTIEKRPAFEQYWRRISARPAALRAKEIDDALVAQEQPQSSG